MKTIPLTQSKVSLVDDGDFENVNQYKWFAHKGNKSKTFYAMRNVNIDGKKSCIYMHRFICNAVPKEQIDHKDNDGLNNQRSNFRRCNNAQNNANKGMYKKTVTGFKGVTRCGRGGKYIQARITANGVKHSLGYYKTEIEAAMAYNEGAKIFHGEFASLNII